VKYITNLPDLRSFRFEAGAQVSSTEHGGINHALHRMVNLPFGNGIGAVRIDGYQVYDSGYAKDPVYPATTGLGPIRGRPNLACCCSPPTNSIFD